MEPTYNSVLRRELGVQERIEDGGESGTTITSLNVLLKSSLR